MSLKLIQVAHHKFHFFHSLSLSSTQRTLYHCLFDSWIHSSIECMNAICNWKLSNTKCFTGWFHALCGTKWLRLLCAAVAHESITDKLFICIGRERKKQKPNVLYSTLLELSLSSVKLRSWQRWSHQIPNLTDCVTAWLCECEWSVWCLRENSTLASRWLRTELMMETPISIFIFI